MGGISVMATYQTVSHPNQLVKSSIISHHQHPNNLHLHQPITPQPTYDPAASYAVARCAKFIQSPDWHILLSSAGASNAPQSLLMMTSGNTADASIDAVAPTPSGGVAVSITAAKATVRAEFAVDGLSAAFPAPDYPPTQSPTSDTH